VILAELTEAGYLIKTKDGINHPRIRASHCTGNGAAGDPKTGPEKAD
jgi:hypothetical protein